MLTEAVLFLAIIQSAGSVAQGADCSGKAELAQRAEWSEDGNIVVKHFKKFTYVDSLKGPVPSIGVTCDTTSNLCTDANTECDTATNTCICSDGFTDSDGDTTNTAGTCQADLGTTCTQDSDCTAQNTNAECTGATGAMTCTCASGYCDSNTASTAGGTCEAVLKATCTDETKCGDIDSNAECTGETGAKTCNCKSGYFGCAGDVCSNNSAGHNASSFWFCAILVLLFAKSILL